MIKTKTITHIQYIEEKNIKQNGLKLELHTPALKYNEVLKYVRTLLGLTVLFRKKDLQSSNYVFVIIIF